MGYLPGLLTIAIVAGSRLFAQAGHPEPTVLEPDRTIERQIAGGQSHEYEFTLQTGQYATVRAEQLTVNLAVRCFGPNGKGLFQADSYPIGDAEVAELIADVSGTFRLQLIASEPHAPNGLYRITLRKTAAATARHTERVAAARAFALGTDSYRQGTRKAMLEATRHFADALAHWRAAGDPVEVAKTLCTLGLTYIEIGDQEEALKHTTLSLAAAEDARDLKANARALNSVGEVHNYFGDKRKAAGYYEQALPLMRAIGDSAGEGNALNNLGVAYAHTGEKPKALGLFADAGNIFRELQDRRMLAEVASNTGVTYDNLGEYRKALECHQSALKLKHELGDRASQAVSLNNIGMAYSGLGEYQKALDAYTAALEINRSMDNRRSVAINLNNIAWVYDKLLDRRRALNFYQESLLIVRAINDRRTTAVTLNNIAEIHAALGDYQKALQLHTEALSFRRAVSDIDGEANSLNHLGTSLAKLGEMDKARGYFERALGIQRAANNPYMLARTLINLGALDRETGNDIQARARLNEAIAIGRKIHDRGGEAEALAELSRLERGQSNYVAAHQRAEEALTALESVRLAIASPALRASFFASAREIQELDIEALMRLHADRPAEGFGAAALSASERARARSLLELLSESGTEILQGVDAGLLDQERELELRLSAKAGQQVRLLSGRHTDSEAAAAEKEVETLTTGLEQIQGRIRETSPQYAALTQSVTLNLKDIQARVLDGDTVLLEYALGAKRSFVWAVTSSSMDVFELPPRAAIESAVRPVYNLLTARNRWPPNETPAARANRIRLADQGFSSAAATAGRMLLGPVASMIGSKRLLIVAEGVLQYLPFAALPEPSIDGHGNSAPLIAGHEIISVPSASVMAVLRQETVDRKPAEKTVAILADPVFSSDDERIARQRSGTAARFAARGPASNEGRRSRAGVRGQEFLRLRFSRYEADEIARMAPSGASMKALDFDASRDTVLNPGFGRYRIVHFATHSLLNAEHPELSGIVLSLFDRAGRPRNGFLRLYDIYNLRLGSDLVVLSSCQTAMGGEIKGEGLIGLTRGFLYAGAPRVVASLWEVDDRTTAELMKRFYAAMLGHGERAAAALRTAQVAFHRTKGWDAPYYWAAFTLQGEWR